MPGNYERKDSLYRKAKKEGYRSRAAYKLLELDKKHRFLKPGKAVLDLGCFPGSWMQVAIEKLGQSGIVVGVDLVEVEAFEEEGFDCTSANSSALKVRRMVGDATSTEVQARLENEFPEGIDVVLSDMSPKLSGVSFRDAQRSLELVELAFQVASSMLKKGGVIVAKIFPSPDADLLFGGQKKNFDKLLRINLDASRKTSTEMYFVGIGKK